MKRILIIGCCGAGKSTFAKALQDQLKLPIIHLDQAYWQPNWVETPKAEWNMQVKLLAAEPSYIMDGNYTGSLSVRLPRADTVFYLDFPTLKCFWRVIKRIRKYRGTVRPDMPAGCVERYDFDFLHYVLIFNIVVRKRILKILETAGSETEIITFKKDREIEEYLSDLSSKSFKD